MDFSSARAFATLGDVNWRLYRRRPKSYAKNTGYEELTSWNIGLICLNCCSHRSRDAKKPGILRRGRSLRLGNSAIKIVLMPPLLCLLFIVCVRSSAKVSLRRRGASPGRQVWVPVEGVFIRDLNGRGD